MPNPATKYKHPGSSIKHKCEQCEYWSPQLFRVNKHVKLVHQKIKQCSLCNFHTESQLELNKHLNIEHKVKMLFCERCSYSTHYLRKYNLNVHIKQVHNKSFDQFCDHCDSSYSNMTDLRRHQKIAHEQTTASQNLPSYSKKCTECPYSTKHLSSLRNHLLKAHQFAMCMNCSYRGNSFEELRNHCLEFHESMYNIDPTRCHICKYSAQSAQFSSNFLSKTMIHIMAAHGGEHPCPTCNKNFKQKRHLNEHINKCHLRKFHIRCEECNQAFWRKKNLEEHIRSYHREKPDIICTKCNKKLSSKGFLKLHMRVHEKSKINGNKENSMAFPEMEFETKDEAIPKSSQNRQKDDCSPNLRCPVMRCLARFSDISEVNVHLGNDHNLE